MSAALIYKIRVFVAGSYVKQKLWFSFRFVRCREDHGEHGSRGVPGVVRQGFGVG